MNKPCYFEKRTKGKEIIECSVPACNVGTDWVICGYGALYREYIKEKNNAKLAKARKIREEVFQYFKDNFTGLIYPHVLKNKTKSAVTKIIKKHL